MTWCNSSARSLLLTAAFSMTLVGCGSSRSALDLRAPIPELDSKVRESCKDPGIDRNAEVAIAQHRQALADCEDKRALAVEDGDLVREKFGLRRPAAAHGVER